MQTDYKYITYREEKRLYAVRMTVNGEKVYKSFVSLETAISYRNMLLVKRTRSRVTEHFDHVPRLNEAVEIFIERRYRAKVKPSTLYNFQVFARKIGGILGNVQIDHIDHQLWQDVLLSVQEQRQNSKEHIRAGIRRFRAMYAYFVEQGAIEENPLLYHIDLHKTPISKRRAFTQAEKRKFLAAAKSYSQKWYFLFFMYFQTGCRRGELVALKWEDVDFLNQRISINKAICRGDDNGLYTEFVGETKTPESVRLIPISDQAIKVLKENFDKYKPLPSSYVFKPKVYSKLPWVSLSSVNNAFAIIRRLANIDEKLTLHCVRHTFATELIAGGVDIPTVQRLGGWSTPKTLLYVYAHSTDEAATKAMQKVIFSM
ncbi:Site-specific recombinase XerD [Selenomonas ruminantium]|uniref:Site-specific recombinase XerD n=1 Tax=Selenomonas ruminantium TaxID=971 RepID=A0A1M6VJW7_SELRU|nr:site-specific integrase [Selenomonas ruminantium]SHK81802.1 Site-specific recombinase XerD [Selenomonas ruminantium]